MSHLNFLCARIRRCRGWADVRVLIVLTLIGLAITPQRVNAAAVAEYVRVQHPVDVNLQGEHSATESIGAMPESLVGQYEPLTFLPGHVLPMWRKKYWPKTNQPFIDDVEFSIHPRFYYFHRDIYRSGVQESAAFGGSLSAETGWLNETLRFGMTVYTSQKLYGPSDRDGVKLLAPGQQGYTVLGEAYVDLKHGETMLRAGRSRVNLPFINAWDFRMTPYTFELVGVRSQEIENLRIGAGHFFNIKTTTSTDFESMSQVAGVDGVDRGVSVISLRYDFTDDNFVALSNQYGWDMFNTLYVEGEHLFEISDRWTARIGAQYIDQRSVGCDLLGDFKTQSGGVKASLQYCNVEASLSYTWTSNSRGVLKPWGGTPAYNSSIIEDFDRSGEQSFRIGASYDFSVHGLDGVSLDTGWITGDTPDSGKHASPDQTEFDCTINYQPSEAMFDGMWFRVRYANSSMDDDSRIEDFRVELNYSYTF